jgi:CheY-like chemotaxis protein
MRLYVCDDNPSHRALVRAVLEPERDLRVVGDGWDIPRVVEEVAELQPDAVLVDMGMPGIDGVGALAPLREAAPRAALIMLSTAWSPAEEQRALAAGATAYVQKPRVIFDLPVLVRGAAGDAGALVEHLVRMWLAGDIDRACAAVHHDVEYRPLLLEGPVHGREALRRVPEQVPDAKVTPVGLVERGEDVVLFGEAELDRGRGVEHLSPAWLMTVLHGKVARIRTFGSWEDAQEESGLTRGRADVSERRLGDHLRWLLAAPRKIILPGS